MQIHVRGLDVDRPAEGLGRLVQPTHLPGRQAQFHEGLHVGRVDGNGRPELLHRLLEPAGTLQEQAVPVPVVGKIGVGLDGVGVVAEFGLQDLLGLEFLDDWFEACGREVEFPAQGRRHRRPHHHPRDLPVQGAGARGDFARHLDHLVGLALAAHLAVRHRQADVRLQVRVVDAHGPLVQADARLRSAALHHYLATEHQRVEVPRIQRQCLLQVIVGGIEVAGRRQQPGRPEMHVRVIGMGIEDAADFGQRLLRQTVVFEAVGQ